MGANSYFPTYMPVEDHAHRPYAGVTEPIREFDYVGSDSSPFKMSPTAARLSDLPSATSAMGIPAVRPSHKIDDASSSFYMGWVPSPTESNASSLGSTASYNSMTSSSISSTVEVPAKTEVPAPKQRKESLYKTELCRSFEEKGHCDYGVKWCVYLCSNNDVLDIRITQLTSSSTLLPVRHSQFAHGKADLRPIQRHPKWKTELCRTFWRYGACAYAKRCCFVSRRIS